jgi:type IV pilus assembly protein PilW
MTAGGACADTIPTLTMVENGGTAQLVLPLAEGIENMQFDYGIDNNFDGAPDVYRKASAITDADWRNVMAVRVNLLARNTEETPGPPDTKTYTLGEAAPITPGGRFKRHVYSQAVRAVNPSGRRE